MDIRALFQNTPQESFPRQTEADLAFGGKAGIQKVNKINVSGLPGQAGQWQKGILQQRHSTKKWGNDSFA